MKKILFFLYFLSIFANADEIKLTCKVRTESLYSNGIKEKLSGLIDLEINEIEDKTWISVSSNLSNINEISVLSYSFNDDSNRFISTNLSNSNKWDINTLVTYIKSGQYVESTEIRIKIDRNTGNLNIYSETKFTDKSNILTTVSGTCSKVDTTKNKF